MTQVHETKSITDQIPSSTIWWMRTLFSPYITKSDTTSLLKIDKTLIPGSVIQSFPKLGEIESVHNEYKRAKGRQTTNFKFTMATKSFISLTVDVTNISPGKSVFFF